MNRARFGLNAIVFSLAALGVAACIGSEDAPAARPQAPAPTEDAGNDGNANGEPDDAGNAGDTNGDASADFPTIATTPGRAEYTFVHDGEKRVFIVYVPQHAPEAKPAPLMVVLHGGGGSARAMFSGHPLEPHADDSGVVMVAVQGTPAAEGGNGWNNNLTVDDGHDDVGYLERVILGVSAALKLDPKRRYLAGFSGGATMGVRFVSEKSEFVTALGTFAGKVGRSESASPPFVFPAAPTTPVSVQMTYGTLDENYAGGLKDGFLFTSAKEGIAWWTQVLACKSAVATETKDKLTLDTYSGCNAGTVVRMITVEGMPHMWPNKDDGLDGTQLMLDFFKDKVKP